MSNKLDLGFMYVYVQNWGAWQGPGKGAGGVDGGLEKYI